jgi:molecular chaperone DnaK
MRRQILQRDVEVEKSLNDHKDKLPQDVVDGVTTAVGDLKKAVESENVEDIKQKISDARQVSMKIGEALMKNQASGTAGTGFDGGQAAEAEYEDVKGKK